MKDTNVWVVTADSESGEFYLLGVWDHKPTAAELDLMTHKDILGDDGWHENDPDPGFGHNGSYVYPRVDISILTTKD